MDCNIVLIPRNDVARRVALRKESLARGLKETALIDRSLGAAPSLEGEELVERIAKVGVSGVPSQEVWESRLTSPLKAGDSIRDGLGRLKIRGALRDNSLYLLK